MVRAMCGVQLKYRKRSMDLMFMQGLNETIGQLALANSVCWYDHLLRREDGHVLRRAFDYEVEGEWKKGRPRRMWKKQVEGESVKVGLRREDALCRSKWGCWHNLVTLTCRGYYQIVAGLRLIWSPSLVGDTSRF